MKRKSFFKSLLMLFISPKIISEINTEPKQEIDAPEWAEYYQKQYGPVIKLRARNRVLRIYQNPQHK